MHSGKDHKCSRLLKLLLVVPPTTMQRTDLSAPRSSALYQLELSVEYVPATAGFIK